MARMVRKQILLDEELEAVVEVRAAKAGISQGELIRRTLRDALLGEQERRQAAAERLMAMIDEWQQAHPPARDPDEVTHDRGWTREELYEDEDGHPWGFRTGSARGRERTDLSVGREGSGQEQDSDDVDV